MSSDSYSELPTSRATQRAERLYTLERPAAIGVGLAGALSLAMFWPLDILSQPENAVVLGVLRIPAAVACLVAGIGTWNGTFGSLRSLRASVLAAYLISALFVGATVPGSVSGGAYTWYCFGYSLIIFTAGLFLALPPAAAGGLQAALIGMFALAHLIWPPILGTESPGAAEVGYGVTTLSTAALFCFANMVARYRERLDIVDAEIALRHRNEQLSVTRVEVAAERALNAAKNAFLTRMSHELRTPLNAILGYAEMAREACEDAALEETVSDLERVDVAGHTLLGLIQDILDLTALEAGEVRFAPERLDLAAVVAEVTTELESAATAKGLRLHLAETEPTSVEHDPSRMRQVMTILVGNAVRFTSAGEVAVAIERPSEATLAIRVDDSGPGLPPGDPERLFAPFEQGDSSTTRRQDGAGLGLSVARALARRMGGDITAENRNTPDGDGPIGARFVLHLPVAHPGLST